jgi:hypothetical protein
MSFVVNALTVFDDGGGSALYAGGDFTTAGGVTVNNIAQWNGATWSPLGVGLNGDVRALTVFDDGLGGGPALYAGGLFATAGGVPVNRIAKWDGTIWSALGGGTGGAVQSLTVFDDGLGGGPALYAGGVFSVAGGLNIARWNGAMWSPLSTGISSNVLALTVFDDGSGPALYAGGLFATAGGVPANHIAKWDGTIWSALGTGMSGAVSPRAVNALAVFDDGLGGGPALYAGGFFTTAGGVPASNIAKWNGATWSPLGVGLNFEARALTVFDDGLGGGPALYAGGFFTTAGGVPANRIAKWDGTSWSALGTGMNSDVVALTGFDDGSGPALYAGGNFTTAGGVGANRIAKWDGTSWSALGSGVTGGFNPRVFALFDDGFGGGPALYAGGSFTTTPDSGDSFLARWGCATAGSPSCAADLADARDSFLEPSPGSFVVTEGETITASFVGDDPDDDPLTMTVTGLPPGATISPASGTTLAPPYPVTFQWTPTAADKPGAPYTVSVTFDDGEASASCLFAIEDINLRPDCSGTVGAGGTLVFECDGPSGKEVTLGGSATDEDDAILMFHWDVSDLSVDLDNPNIASPTGTFPIGITMATLTVADGRGGVDICDVLIEVQDTQPPEVMCTTSAAALWPPRHEMIEVQVIVTATDDCEYPDFVFPLVITCRSDEPDDAGGVGDGNTTGDVDGQDGFTAPVDIFGSMEWDSVNHRYTGTISLRAERDGTGDGRKYTIDVMALDSHGNAAITSCCVVVPHDRRGGTSG